MAKVIMVQGTMSGAGKSLLTAGLCRIFHQDGRRAAPFKSQNMALNSFITAEGLEMGRAQVMQAEAAGIPPMVCMNPVLLKPTDDTGSQVIVNGEVLGNMGARDYFEYKVKLIPTIKKAFQKLEQYADIIVIEGAGSPAEINLKQNDIVNMGMAEMVDAPVLLVGDIDRGGVFAQLLGTVMLLEDREKARVKGLVINKFRGDRSILDPGIEMLEERGRIPVTGVVPYMELSLEDEDSLTERFGSKGKGLVDIAVIRFPRISNFTDFNVFEQIPEVSVRYVGSGKELQRPDLVFLPGSKNTMGDLKWMRQNGLEAAVKKLAAEDVPVFGICGGYQMLGYRIEDPGHIEEGGSIRGMELLPVTTVLQKSKRRRRTVGSLNVISGVLGKLSGIPFGGYEIHMGETLPLGNGSCPKEPQPLGNGSCPKEPPPLGNGSCPKEPPPDGKRHGGKDTMPVITSDGRNIYGSYVHGLFDMGTMAECLVRILAERKGVAIQKGVFEDYRTYKEGQYDKLADTLRECLDMEAIYGMLTEARL